MRILFYSNSCNFCLKLVEYIEKNNLKDFFKMINIDTTNNIPNTVLICGTKPIAQFNLPSSLCLNKCIALKDSSLNKPGSWQWTINSPSTFSTINTPTVSNFCFNIIIM